MDWQPIETAPKDGTRIIGWNGDVVTEMGWVGRADDDGHVGWCQAEFWDGGLLYEMHNQMEPEPTHWMPLPDPPKDDT